MPSFMSFIADESPARLLRGEGGGRDPIPISRNAEGGQTERLATATVGEGRDRIQTHGWDCWEPQGMGPRSQLEVTPVW